MLADDFEISGFSVQDWQRLGSLFPNPLRFSDGAARTDRRGLLAVGRRDCLLGLWRVGEGPLDISQQPWPASLSELAASHGAPWVISLHPSCLSEAMERFGARLRPTDTRYDQWVLMLRVVAELVSEAAINAWPRRLLSWTSLLTDNVARSSLDVLCPPGKALLLGAFDEGGLFTCVTLVRGESGFERVLGPGHLLDEVDLLSGDWRRDYAHLLKAVELHIAPVAGGCFSLAATLRQLFDDPAAGAWSAAVASREVVLQPLNPALALPVGFDAGRAALSSMQALAQRVLAGGVAESTAMQRLKKMASGEQDVSELLNFDPVVALLQMLKDDRGD